MAGGGVCVFADLQSASFSWFTVKRFNRGEIGTVSGRIADESISHDPLSESSPCAIRCDRGNQTPLRFRGGGRVSQPQRNLWPSAARLLAREPGSEERPALPGRTTPCPVSSSVIRAHLLH